MHNFSPEDLLLYLYNEPSPAKSARIRAALETDWSLREKFEVFSSAHARLEVLKMSPTQRTVNNILNYAEKAIAELSPQL